MSIKHPDMTVHADLTVLVSRNARGDLYDGVRHRLQKIDGVREVEHVDIRGLRPGLNDLTVEVRARLVLRTDRREVPDDDVAARLTAGFGIKRAVVTADSQAGVG